MMEVMFRMEQDNPYTDAFNNPIPEQTRMRMRMRYGLAYQIDRDVRIGFQVRTGFQNNPQDPQLTIGQNALAGASFPIGLERLYASFSTRSAQFVFGKNYYPFKKYHEMYWSDWVNPTGIYYKQSLGSKFELRSLFSILQSNGANLGNDGFLFGAQLPFSYEDRETKLQVEFNQTLHAFNNIRIRSDMPNTYSPLFYYPAVKLTQPFRKSELYLVGEAFLQLKKLSPMDTLLLRYDNQRTGGMFKLGYIKETRTAKWETSLNYTYLPRYAAVDYLAQNDWARWNYEASGSPAASLTNIQGIEFAFTWHFSEKINLLFKYFNASRIRVPFGELNRESADRFRIDLNVHL